MIEHLADKPVNDSADEWFTKLKRTADLNLPVRERRSTLDGLPTLEVRYRASPGSEGETDAVYVISGSKTFAIEFNSDKPGRALEQLENYGIYLRMMKTFQIAR
ncbi:MAG: hypothetical protein WA419_06725 [Silvibacterium sp.]